MVYLDNSATTRPDPEVVRVMTDVMKNIYGNPSSLHDLGGKAERLIKQAREAVAKTLGVSPRSLVFTSGGTEANNEAIKGVADQYAGRGKHLVTTEVEHASVHQVMRQLEDRGWEVTYLPVDREGRVQVEDVKQALTEETVLVSVMHVNNETGTIQPVEEIGRLLKKYPKILFHVDAVQSYGKLEVRPADWGIDLLTLSGHKIHGPKGIGCMHIREGVKLTPLLAGGGQEEGYRSGTQNVPGIAGFAKAAVSAQCKRKAATPAHYRWKTSLIDRLTREWEEIRINGDVSEDGGAPHILSVSFPGLKSEVIVHALEQEGIYVSSKSACSSKGEKPSRVLMAMGLDEGTAVGTIRISMGLETSEEDIRMCEAALLKVIPQLQQVMKVHGR
ncbi:cysteine desulfurase family protein [Paludifilum halophilum]|uniref:Cysteine desulfurase NifS n=1 Tax=Paludifilum halophilum TaxID=1642702 RepID=A0A235B6W4_9BACL|nr:cysteine desulfurase family protein [Paludifilum halophilum]OYD07729.1 cysteine desulfurase NifS [Paludifilum halophilum]